MMVERELLKLYQKILKNNMDNDNKDTSDKRLNRIEFIDPNDLIKFIEDTNSSKDLKKVKSQENEDVTDELSNNLDEYDNEELYYTDKIDEESKDYVVKRQEDTRGRLAIIYTISTFLIFLLTFIVAILDSILRNTSIIDNLTSILPIVSGIFLGSLGFVIGYYFRKGDNE